MKIVFGTDDENDTTRAVHDFLKENHELSVIESDESWPEMAYELGERVASGKARF